MNIYEQIGRNKRGTFVIICIFILFFLFIGLGIDYCYGSFDLAGNCIFHLMQRGVLPPDAVSRYLTLIPVRAAEPQPAA